MSAGPKSVAPVSRPATAMMTLCMVCSMKGRATIRRTSLSRVLAHSPPSLYLAHASALLAQLVRLTLVVPLLTCLVPYLLRKAEPCSQSAAFIASRQPMRTCMSRSSSKIMMSHVCSPSSPLGLTWGGAIT